MLMKFSVAYNQELRKSDLMCTRELFLFFFLPLIIFSIIIEIMYTGNIVENMELDSVEIMSMCRIINNCILNSMQRNHTLTHKMIIS